jgi:hypothetical protein
MGGAPESLASPSASVISVRNVGKPECENGIAGDPVTLRDRGYTAK